MAILYDIQREIFPPNEAENVSLMHRLFVLEAYCP